MITKERFEDLIKNADENSIIWGVTDYTYHKSKPNLKIDYFKLLNIPSFYKNNIDKFFEMENNTEFFETKEEAEWELEFGNITRTERLSLPSWEEFNNSGESVVFRDVYGNIQEPEVPRVDVIEIRDIEFILDEIEKGVNNGK